MYFYHQECFFLPSIRTNNYFLRLILYDFLDSLNFHHVLLTFLAHMPITSFCPELKCLTLCSESSRTICHCVHILYIRESIIQPTLKAQQQCWKPHNTGKIHSKFLFCTFTLKYEINTFYFTRTWYVDSEL